MSKTRTCIALGLVVTFASIVGAHTDDRKLLDRIGPYVGPGLRGDDAQRGTEFDALNLQLRSWLTLGDLGATQDGNDCWGYVSPTGREYAIMGHFTGTTFVEVTNPSSPDVVAVLSGPVSIWRDIKIYEQHAYVVSEGGDGVQVFDLTNIDEGEVEFVGLFNDTGTTATHNVVINTESGYLYRCGGGSNGLRIYSLANPDAPQFVNWWTDRYVHDAQVVTLKTGPLAGREIAFCCSGFNGGFTQTGLDIVDVTDKNNIQVLGRIVYPGGEYSHQCWLSPDEQYLYINDELEEQRRGIRSTTVVIDVSDLADPEYVGRFNNNSFSITHNNYIRDGILFAANYRSGLRLFDLSNPEVGQEIAFFDTFPNSDSASFNGLWSVYPYFPSGTIIGSDIERGLFVWKLAFQVASVSYPQGRPDFISGVETSVEFELTSPYGAQADPEGFTLNVRVQGETSFTSVSVEPPAEGEPFVASFGDFPCESVVEYYVAGRTLDGTLLTDPPNAPGSFYTAVVANNQDVSFLDEMESSDGGWIVGAPSDTASTGVWERIDPIGTDAQPEDDATINGANAWITGQHTPGEVAGFNDVDGGATTLVSPRLDALAEPGIAFVSYERWYSNNTGAAPNADTFFAHISNDDGETWVELEAINQNPGAWVRRSFQVDRYVTPTSDIRLRFVASDFGNGSVVEAGIDDVDLSFFNCEEATFCAGDCNGSGGVDFDDLVSMLFAFGQIDAECDADTNGTVEFNDLIAALFLFGPCP